jgi:hypothetical protein
MCAKKRDRTSSDFLHYLKDELSNQERHDLERDLEQDPFEKEAMEGLEKISPEKAEEDLLSLHASLRSRLKKRKRIAWYSIAATAASILIVGTIFLNIYDLNPDLNEDQAFTEESFKSFEKKAPVQADKSDKSDGAVPTEELTEAEQAAQSEDVAIAKNATDIEDAAPAEELAISEDAPIVVEYMAAPDAAPDVEQDAEQEQEQKREFQEDFAIDEEAPIAEDAPIVAEHMPAPAVELDHRAIAEENKGVRIRGLSAKKAAQASETLPLEGYVSGVVVSMEDMGPIPGADIVLSGESEKTVSDLDGRFILPSADSQPSVIASFIGMETEVFQLESQHDNMLVMQADPILLDEVIVVARVSDTPKAALTSSSRSVKKEESSPSYSAAEPPDGYRAYRKYVRKNMIFPEEYIQGEREIVVLVLTVTSKGQVSNIMPLRSPGIDYNREAIRLISEGPDWKPALVNGSPIDEQLRIRIVFKQ